MALFAAPTGIRMILHVKSYALKYMISGNFSSQANLQVKTRQPLFVAPAPQTFRSEEWAWIECGRSTP